MKEEKLLPTLFRWDWWHIESKWFVQGSIDGYAEPPQATTVLIQYLKHLFSSISSQFKKFWCSYLFFSLQIYCLKTPRLSQRSALCLMSKPSSLRWAWRCREWVHSQKRTSAPKSCTAFEVFCHAQQHTLCTPVPRKGWPYPDGQGKQDGIYGLTTFKNQKMSSKLLFSFLKVPTDKTFPHIEKRKKVFHLFKL